MFRSGCGTKTASGFRAAPIHVDKLVLGRGVRIGRHVLVRGGHIVMDKGVKVRPNSTLHVTGHLVIGANGTINQDCEISGVDVVIGRELWMLPHAKIGGGSAFEVHSRLRAGHWCHIGVRSFLNTARPIVLGDEVGLGTGTCLYTHGAYASVLEGKPVAFGSISIDDRTWLPDAIVNPSVSIGKDCVIAVGSLVTRDIPDGCLAGGIPAKIIREHAYPSLLTGEKRQAFFADFLRTFSEICSEHHELSGVPEGTSFHITVGNTPVGYVPEMVATPSEWWRQSQAVILTDKLSLDASQIPPQATVIDCLAKRILGRVSPLTERLLNQLRRYGIRFYYEAEDGKYVPWTDSVIAAVTSD